MQIRKMNSYRQENNFLTLTNVKTENNENGKYNSEKIT